MIESEKNPRNKESVIANATSPQPKLKFKKCNKRAKARNYSKHFTYSSASSNPGRDYDSHFMDQETEAWEGKKLAQGHTASDRGETRAPQQDADRDVLLFSLGGTGSLSPDSQGRWVAR